MRISIYMILIVALFNLSACHKSDSNSKGDSNSKANGSIDSSMVGLWVDKDESEELNKTGHLESLCARMKEEPLIGKPSNTRLIESNGAVFIYIPDGHHVPLGTVNKNGDFILKEDFKKHSPNAKFSMKVEGDVLTINANYNGAVDVKVDYVRTDSEEIKKYFSAIDSCP